jgi:hypothetical protein
MTSAAVIGAVDAGEVGVEGAAVVAGDLGGGGVGGRRGLLHPASSSTDITAMGILRIRAP